MLRARICLMPQANIDPHRRKANVRTALAFLSIAVAFFAGIIGARLIGDTAVGIGAMSVAVLAFLAFAIGRSLRK